MSSVVYWFCLVTCIAATPKQQSDCERTILDVSPDWTSFDKVNCSSNIVVRFQQSISYDMCGVTLKRPSLFEATAISPVKWICQSPSLSGLRLETSEPLKISKIWIEGLTIRVNSTSLTLESCTLTNVKFILTNATLLSINNTVFINSSDAFSRYSRNITMLNSVVKGSRLLIYSFPLEGAYVFIDIRNTTFSEWSKSRGIQDISKVNCSDDQFTPSGAIAVYGTATVSIQGPIGTNTFEDSDHEAPSGKLCGGAVTLSGDRLKVIFRDVSFVQMKSNLGGAAFIANGAFALFANVTFSRTNGFQSKPSQGGAIAVCNGTLNISDTVFSNTSAVDGGAVYSIDSNVYLSGQTSITQANAAQRGGALYLGGKGFLKGAAGFTNCTARLGGAIWSGVKVDLTQSSFKSNSAAQGAALFGEQSANLLQCNFTLNFASDSGGAVFIGIKNDRTTVEQCTFTNNRCDNTCGGLRVINAELKNNVFTGNSASEGGAACITNGTVLGGLFSANSANDFAGALRTELQSLLKEVHLTSNRALNGGAVWAKSGILFIENSTFRDNAADQGGGSVYCSGSLVVQQNSYFYNSSASSGGAIKIEGSDMSSSSISNSIFTKNRASDFGGAVYGAPLFSSVIFEYNEASTGGAVELPSVKIGRTEFKDCQFAHNVGTFTAGAIDSQLPFTASSCRFSNNTAPSVGAIAASRGCNISKSSFTSNYAEDDIAAVHLLRGAGVSRFDDCIFSNNRAGSSGKCGGVSSAMETNFKKCEFLNNIASSIVAEGSSAIKVEDSQFKNNFSPAEGGAIVARTITITDSSFIDNRAQKGGCIIVKRHGQIKNTTFINCSSESGGGAVYVSSSDTSAVTPALVVTQSLFRNCSSTAGGAIGAEAFVKIDNTAFEFNAAKGGTSSTGGAVNILEIAGTGISVESSRFIFNNAVAGAAIYARCVANGSVTITNCTFENNNGQTRGAVVTFANTGIKSSSFHKNILTPTSTVQDPKGGALTIFAGISHSIEESNFSNNLGAYGGALYIDIGVISMQRVQFFNNEATEGGAVFISTTSHGNTVNDAVFTGNRAQIQGGAVSCKSNSTWRKMVFTNNSSPIGGAMLIRPVVEGPSKVEVAQVSASTNSALHGGVFTTILPPEFKSSSLVFEDTSSIYSDNHANKGGAIYSDSTNVTIKSSTFVKNQARNNGIIGNTWLFNIDFKDELYSEGMKSTNISTVGGAIISTHGAVVLQGCNLTSNKADTGGGAALLRPIRAALDKVVFVENSADDLGGGLYLSLGLQSLCEISNTYIEKNTAVSGGGLFLSGKHYTALTIYKTTNITDNRLSGGYGSDQAGWPIDIRLKPISKSDAANYTKEFTPGNTTTRAFRNPTEVRDTQVHPGVEIAFIVILRDFKNVTIQSRRNSDFLPLTIMEEHEDSKGVPLQTSAVVRNDGYALLHPVTISGLVGQLSNLTVSALVLGIVQIKFFNLSECAAGYVKEKFGICRECTGGFYAPGGGDVCLPCPNNATCSSSGVRANRTFWAGFKKEGQITLAEVRRCVVPDLCLGDNKCKEHYDESYIMCARCTPGYSFIDFKCVSCGNIARNIFAIILNIIVVEVITIVMYTSAQDDGAVRSAAVSICVYYAQLLPLSLSDNVKNTKVSIKWIESITASQGTIDISCLGGDESFRYHVSNINTALMMLFMFANYAIHRYWWVRAGNSNKMKKLIHSYKNGYTAVVFLSIYTALSSYCKYKLCQEYFGRNILAEQPAVDCDSEAYKHHERALLATFIVIGAVGCGLIVMIILSVNNKNTRKTARRDWAFAFSRFNSRPDDPGELLDRLTMIKLMLSEYWIIVTLLRRCLCLGFYVIATNPSVIGGGGTMVAKGVFGSVVSFFLIFQVVVSPYKLYWDNVADSFAQLGLLVVVVAGFTQQEVVEWTAFLSVTAVVFIYTAVMFVTEMQATWKKFQSKKESRKSLMESIEQELATTGKMSLNREDKLGEELSSHSTEQHGNKALDTLSPDHITLEPSFHNDWDGCMGSSGIVHNLMQQGSELHEETKLDARIEVPSRYIVRSNASIIGALVREGGAYKTPKSGMQESAYIWKSAEHNVSGLFRIAQQSLGRKDSYQYTDCAAKVEEIEYESDGEL